MTAAFSIPETEPFFMHFGCSAKPGWTPYLAMGSANGKVAMRNLLRTEQHGKRPVEPAGPGVGVGKLRRRARGVVHGKPRS